TFDIPELPREVVQTRGGVMIAQYPGLVDLSDCVATRLFADSESADAALQSGVMRLYALAERKELRSQVRWLPSLEQVKVQLGGAIPSASMEQSLMDLLARIAFVESQPAVRSRQEFERRRGDRGQRIAQAAQEVAGWLAALGDNYFQVRQQIESLHGSRFSGPLADVDTQLHWLIFDGFLSKTPWTWLKHYPRYFAAIAYRLDKLRSGAASRDSQAAQIVGELWNRWVESIPEADRQPTKQTTSEFRWMSEELRVSLFAQPLGTSVKVSPQRCDKLLRGR
ncbi:MAG: DUF3418 domain-containing protein, partial [Pirellulales bacterium]|nr:DUF3418 domain-containing protein [Pirellulales bacterium]